MPHRSYIINLKMVQEITKDSALLVDVLLFLLVVVTIRL